jgi:6-pyruvoyltetrahydropterin/6-carboxytetrahydropterin synthase
MKILINGINANLRFSSAHLIPTHPSCGFIHGHSYFVDVEIEGERAGEFKFVVDFKDVKESLRKICNTLDHRLLVPIFNEHISFKGIPDDEKTMEKIEKEEKLQFKIGQKGYTIPKVDCVLLPLKTSSAEDLAQYFAEKLTEDLLNKGYDNLNSISACVNEGIGQGALYKNELN